MPYSLWSTLGDNLCVYSIGVDEHVELKEW